MRRLRIRHLYLRDISWVTSFPIFYGNNHDHEKQNAIDFQVSVSAVEITNTFQNNFYLYFTSHVLKVDLVSLSHSLPPAYIVLMP